MVLTFLCFWIPSGSSTMALLPDLLTTVFGTGWYGVDSLFIFFCCTSTWSPTWMLLLMAPRLVSAYSFSLVFFSASRSLISGLYSSSLNSGSLVLIFLPNSDSAGQTPVVACGVVLYENRYFLSSFFRFFFSNWMIFKNLSSD